MILKRSKITLFVLFLFGCQTRYVGDGYFIDAGLGSAADRYQLSLGSVDVCQHKRYTYRIGQLPPEDFKIKLAYCETSLDETGYKDIEKVISATIVDVVVELDSGGEAFKYKGPLWENGNKRGGGYYQKGMHPLYNSRDKCANWVFMPDQIGYAMKAGLTKVFRTHEERELRLTIVQAAEMSEKTCNLGLSLVGGGWK